MENSKDKRTLGNIVKDYYSDIAATTKGLGHKLKKELAIVGVTAGIAATLAGCAVLGKLTDYSYNPKPIPYNSVNISATATKDHNSFEAVLNAFIPKYNETKREGTNIFADDFKNNKYVLENGTSGKATHTSLEVDRFIEDVLHKNTRESTYNSIQMGGFIEGLIKDNKLVELGVFYDNNGKGHFSITFKGNKDDKTYVAYFSIPGSRTYDISFMKNGKKGIEKVRRSNFGSFAQEFLEAKKGNINPYGISTIDPFAQIPKVTIDGDFLDYIMGK